MNKLILAAGLLFVGGFAIGDAANLNAIETVGFSGSSDDTTAAISVPEGTSADACKVGFRRAEEAYKVAMKEAKKKHEMAVRVKNACLKQAQTEAKKEKRSRETLKPTPSATSSVQ
ncbi:MAG: hypothetical protein AAB483_02690 [Patescibacteria group bacterium]